MASLARIEVQIRMKLFRISRLCFSSLALTFLWLVFCPGGAYAQLTFDKPKTEGPLPNPYTIGGRRDDVLKTVLEVFRKCEIPVDESASSANEGRIVTKPVVYTRGVTAKSDLEHLSTLPAGDVRNWLQGRYSLEVTALPLDQNRIQLFVSGRIQGRLGGIAEGEKWVDATSNGTLEDEVLRGLAGKILGLDLSLKGKGQRRLLNCEY